MTMTLVSTGTVGSGGASTIDFTGIPATGTDLVILFSCRSNYAGPYDEFNVKINGTAGSAYSDRMIFGQNGSVSSYSSSNTSHFVWVGMTGDTATSNVFGNGSVYIPNYASSNVKSLSIDFVNENNATNNTVGIDAGLWNNTAAITSISLYPGFGTLFLQYSTASLYTITKGSGGATVS